MPSTKRNRGKARRARSAAASCANANDDADVPSQTPRQKPQNNEQHPDQLHRLLEGISLQEKCDHGLGPLLATSQATALVMAYDAACDDSVGLCFEKSPMFVFVDVMKDLFQRGSSELDFYNPANRAGLIAGFVSLGTDYLLRNGARNTNIATMMAIAGHHLEVIGGGRCTGADALAWARDLGEGGERTVVKFFSTRIRCGCLKERRASSKTQSKLGLCLNCKQTNERSKLFMCTRCGYAQYCSKMCQELHWPKHGRTCSTIKATDFPRTVA